MRVGLACFLVAAAFLLSAPGTQACAQDENPYRTTPSGQADREPPEAYRRAVELGFKEFELGNYVEAEARFLEADAVFDNARVLRALGMVEYELRKYARCKEFLERALRSEIRPLSADERAETEGLLAQSRGYLAHYTILTQPAAVELTLDNAPLTLDADHSVVLSVGDHTLDARSPNFLSTRRELHVQGREERTIRLQLLPQQSQAEHQDDSHFSESPWLWVGVGIVAVGAGVALAYALRPGAKTEVDMPLTTGQSPPGVIIRALGAR